MNIETFENEPTESENLTFKIQSTNAGARLDAFLASQIEGWSRSRLHRLIEDGDVLINGKVLKPSYKLHADDEIDVELVYAQTESFKPEDIPLNIIYEDNEIIVINKPAGLVIHPGAGVPHGTLANALAFHFQNLAQRGGTTRPGIVHRLDKGTSGLIVVAKTEATHENLSEQFRNREIFKSYIALVHGQMQEDSGRIEVAIGRDHNRTRMSCNIDNGRAALTFWRVKKNFERFTLLDVEIKTGRTHQICVHLAHIKHPIVSDETYGGGRDKTIQNIKQRAAIAKLGRIFLHASELGFRHPQTGEGMKFKAELPNELSQLLAIFE